MLNHKSFVKKNLLGLSQSVCQFSVRWLRNVCVVLVETGREGGRRGGLSPEYLSSPMAV